MALVRKILLAMAPVFLLLMSIHTVMSAGYDFSGRVTWVQNGNTFVLDIENWVRLADISAPNSTQPGYNESKLHLYDLVFNKIVYLDVDDQLDPYGRIVCVAYVYYNATHYLNVNKAMLDDGYASQDDFSNKFDPATWTYLVPSDQLQPYPTTPDYTSLIILGVVAAVVVIAILIYFKK